MEMQAQSNYKCYVHIFPNGKLYYGITSQTLKKRFGCNGAGYKQCPKIQKAIEKYGWENIEHKLIMDGLTKEQAEELEISLIARHKTTDDRYGYNIENGGNVTGTHSEETKRKISAGNKGKKKPPQSEEARAKISAATRGENNPFYGRHHSEEVRKAQSEFMKGNTCFKGKHHSEEFKKWKSKQMHEKYSNGGVHNCRVVEQIKDGEVVKEYFALSEAARENGFNLTTLWKYLHRGEEYKGYIWRYKNG